MNVYTTVRYTHVYHTQQQQETVKTRMQVSGAGIAVTFRGILHNEGVPAFWKGLFFAYGRELSYTSIKLGAYAPVRDALGAGKDAPFYMKFLAGAITGGVGSAVGCVVLCVRGVHVTSACMLQMCCCCCRGVGGTDVCFPRFLFGRCRVANAHSHSLSLSVERSTTTTTTTTQQQQPTTTATRLMS